jgi:hypothetical protein
MSSRTHEMLLNVFSNGQLSATFPRGMVPMKARTPEAPISEFTPPAAKRRTSIWDMHHSVHCSIIGTCLSSAELRRLMIKLAVNGADTAGDHDLHKQGVTLVERAHGGGKLIQRLSTGVTRPRSSSSPRPRTRRR